MTRIVVRGTLLTWDGLVPATVMVEDGRIAEVTAAHPAAGASSAAAAYFEATILPGLVNGHTHMGDAFIGEAPPHLSLRELVAPPDGYKHRRLAEASRDEKLEGMCAWLERAWRLGVSVVHDFREEGLPGIALAREALALAASRGAMVEGRLYGRPARDDGDGGRGARGAALAELLGSADGLGLSALGDASPEERDAWRERARAAGKPLALHVSEGRRDVLADALALAPAFLVHLCAAADEDLEALARSGRPAVFCPRSNARFGLAPPAARAARLGIPFALGTDNAMLASPDLFAEARLLAATTGGELAPLDIARAAFLGGRVLSPESRASRITAGDPADLVLLTPVLSDLEALLGCDAERAITARIHGRVVTRFGSPA